MRGGNSTRRRSRTSKMPSSRAPFTRPAAGDVPLPSTDGLRGVVSCGPSRDSRECRVDRHVPRHRRYSRGPGCGHRTACVRPHPVGDLWDVRSAFSLSAIPPCRHVSRGGRDDGSLEFAARVGPKLDPAWSTHPPLSYPGVPRRGRWGKRDDLVTSVSCINAKERGTAATERAMWEDWLGPPSIHITARSNPELPWCLDPRTRA